MWQSRQKALADLHQMQTVHVCKLVHTICSSFANFKLSIECSISISCLLNDIRDCFNFLFFFQLEKLSDVHCTPESQLKFITEAWLQVNCHIIFRYYYYYFFFVEMLGEGGTKEREKIKPCIIFCLPVFVCRQLNAGEF